MIYQVNLYNHWVPFCTKGENLYDLSPLEKVCYLQFKIPFLAERYAYFYAMGIDRIDENGTIVIYGEGISENEEALRKYNVVPDAKKIDKKVVLDLKYFICEISYVSKNEFYLRCYGELDSHMPILPQWLVNTVIKQLGGFIFDKVIKQSKELKGSVWEKEKLKSQAEGEVFYDWLHKRVEDWSMLKGGQNIPKGKIWYKCICICSIINAS